MSKRSRKEIRRALVRNRLRKSRADSHRPTPVDIDEIKKMRKLVSDTKSQSKCVLCPEAHPACLGFHHRNPKTKLFCIAEAARIGCTLHELIVEISKCDILCHNCHSKLHWNESHGV